MTEHDIRQIEARLGIRLPGGYRQFVLSQSLCDVFSDVEKVVAANEQRRQMSWLGRPLDRSFYVFGEDAGGRELFLDLDFPEPPVLAADHAHRRGRVLARTFDEWLDRQNLAKR